VNVSGEEGVIINLSSDEGIPHISVKLLSTNKIVSVRYLCSVKVIDIRADIVM
jgi:hypothetical protein